MIWKKRVLPPGPAEQRPASSLDSAPAPAERELVLLLLREETCAAAMAAFLWAMEEGEDEEGEDEEAEEEGGGCFGSTTSTTPVVRTMMEREGRERAPDASRAETEMANSQPEGRRVRMWRVADVVSSPSMSVPWSDQERAYSTAPGRWDQAREREDAFVSTRVRPSTAWSPEKRMEEEEEEGGMGAEGGEGREGRKEEGEKEKERRRGEGKGEGGEREKERRREGKRDNEGKRVMK